MLPKAKRAGRPTAVQVFKGGAHVCSQSGDFCTNRIGAVSARVLSRTIDAVQSGRSGTWPPVSAIDLAQTRSRSCDCRNRRHPLDDAVRAQRRVHGRMLNAASSRVLSGSAFAQEAILTLSSDAGISDETIRLTVRWINETSEQNRVESTLSGAHDLGSKA